MTRDAKNPASPAQPVPGPSGDRQEDSRKDAKAPRPREAEELDGKTDSGPEPEVHGRDIPPQD